MADDEDQRAVWGGLKMQSQIKRSQNRDNSAELLRAASIPFESSDMGVHLIVRPASSSFVIDFWPGTGKWIVRGHSGVHMRGVRNLLQWCKERAFNPASK